jgi:hypothetical protein
MFQSADEAIFAAVVLLRLLVPLLVFRFPLPSILASLVIDAADQTVFQQFTSLDLTNYQSYDKALDVYYLTLAYLSTMRNWRHGGAFSVGRFLFYYRLVGVAVFELVPGDNRVLLLVFANTFEYFFIFVEAVQVRWDARRQSARFWLLAAAFIWVFIKLPQEYWIHVAQLDFTDAVAAHPSAAAVLAVLATCLLAVVFLWLRSRVRPADHAFSLMAPALPADLQLSAERRRERVARGGVFDRALLEKVVLVSLVTVIFAEILPRVTATAAQVAAAATVLVVLNSAVGLVTARAGRGFDSAALTFVALALINGGLVALVGLLRPSRPYVNIADTLFFVLLISLIVSLYERYLPVHAEHQARWQARAQGHPGIAEGGPAPVPT